MNNITCPHCDQVFEIDAPQVRGAKQVRSAEFERPRPTGGGGRKRHKMEMSCSQRGSRGGKREGRLRTRGRSRSCRGNSRPSSTEIELARRYWIGRPRSRRGQGQADKEAQNELEASGLKSELAVKGASAPLEAVMELGAKVDSAETERELLEKSLAERHPGRR